MVYHCLFQTWTLLRETKGCIQSSPMENRIKRSIDGLAIPDASFPAHTLSVRIRVLLPRHHYVASGE